MTFKPVFGPKAALRGVAIFLMPFLGILYVISCSSFGGLKKEICLDSAGRTSYEVHDCHRENLPARWRHLKSSELSDEWRNESPNRYARIEGDFNGDGITDVVTYLVNDSKNKYGLFIWWDGKLSEKPSQIISENDSTGFEIMGLELQKPDKMKTACGKGYWDCEKDEPAEVEFKYDAISFYRWGSAASVFYWNKKTSAFDRIWISD